MAEVKPTSGIKVGDIYLEYFLDNHGLPALSFMWKENGKEINIGKVLLKTGQTLHLNTVDDYFLARISLANNNPELCQQLQLLDSQGNPESEKTPQQD